VDFCGCRQPTGPVGAGHITVTFEPDGSVSKVALDQGVFTEGTPTGDCLVQKLRAIRVRPFSGPAVRVGKAFRIE
jgi:hypothetical protein